MRVRYLLDKPELSDAVLQAMKDQGLKKAEVARRLGITRQYFGRILARKVVISMETLKRIEEVLGIDLGVGNG